VVKNITSGWRTNEFYLHYKRIKNILGITVIFDTPKVLLLVRKVLSWTYVLLLITNNRNLAFPAHLFI